MPKLSIGFGKDKQVNSLKIPLRRGKARGMARAARLVRWRPALVVDQLHLYALAFQLMLILERQTRIGDHPADLARLRQRVGLIWPNLLESVSTIFSTPLASTALTTSARIMSRPVKPVSA